MSQESEQATSTKELSPLQQSYYVIKKLKASLEATEQRRTEPIAIIGASCRFPGGAADMESYWRVLREGVDAVREVPRDRWDVAAFYDPDPAAPGKTATRHAAFLDEVDQFDPLFFGISPREAISLDPQQRLLLELSWEALERAGYAPDRLAAERTGVFVGIGQVDYAQLLMNASQGVPMDVYVATGNGFCYASGRLSYVLGLRGPNLAVDTACSSSLVAVHLACQSLRTRECDLALASGVQLMLTTQAFVGLTKLGAISTDGRCKTFDASADGYGRGEGAGVIVLKRLSDALAAGDQIAALIRGSAVNHDGSSSGFVVPNGLAQQEVVRRALGSANIKPTEVGYVEAHGTGTQLGDPIEVEALAEVFGPDRPLESPLMIGSVKTNIGHLEAAAGIAGLLKVVLALQHGEIPPHLNLKTPSPHIRWNQMPVKVPTAPTRWETKQLRRVAGVSSFGMSGTNAHVVLEEAPAVEFREAFVDRARHLLPLSARTPKALAELIKRSEVFLAANPDTSLGDFCFTSATGRVHLQCRATVVAATVAEMRQRLATLVPEQSESGGGQPPRIAFLCTGQGAQFVGMGRSLYRTQPSFRATVDQCAELLRPHLDRSLLEVLFPEIGAESPLHDTAYTQPALFTLEYALAKLWMAWGLRPGVMMGHSVGEYVAACLAGVFSLEDGLKLIARRAQLMQSLPRGGAMAVVFADAAAAAAAIASEADRVSIAALNGTDNTVISGDGEAVGRALLTLEGRGIRSTRLQVSHAFHSPLMEPMLAEFEQVAREARYQPPRQPIVSNLTGQLAGAEIATPEYWVQHVRRPVQFAAGMATLERQGYTVFVEIGPKPTLLAMGRRCVSEAGAHWLPSLSEGQEDWQVMLQSVARLYELRVPIDWQAFDGDYNRRRMTLPTYPFQRQRYWLDLDANRPMPALAGPGPTTVHPLLGARLRLPLSRETRFETRFSLSSPGFLQDHKLFDTVVVPGASHVAMVLCALHEAFASDFCVLEDVIFPQALVLNEERSVTLQTILMPEGDSTGFRVVSLAAGADEADPDAWTVHVSGRLQSIVPEGELTPPEGLDALRANCPYELSAADFYSTFRQAGYGLGESFQWLESIWQGEGEAVARLRVPKLSDSLAAYWLHPGLIDSSFQLSAACWRGTTLEAGSDEIFIPFAIDRFQSYRAPREGELWCHTRIRTDSTAAEGTSIADTRLFDSQGRLVAEIIGRKSRRASRKRLFGSLYGNLNDALYELAWRAAPAVSELPAAGGRWLVLWPGDVAGAQLVEQLRNRGDECITVEPGETFERLDANRIRLSPDNPAHFARLVQDVGSTACAGIVHLWSVENGCASVLHLVHALAGAGWRVPPRVWLVTRNGVVAGPERRPLALEQSPLWGLGRVIALEHPELRCVRIDLDAPVDRNDAQLLASELAASGQEDQVAFRAGQRYVARLARLADAPDQIQPDQPTGPYRLAMSAFGVLDELRLQSMTRRQPGRGEVEIAVRATGLNLRDVLLALGMFNDQLERVGISSATQVPFGFECAGEITAVGEGVDHVKVGDEVMALTLGGMNSHVIVDARLVCPTPAELSFEQATTIPLAFMTAYFGLHHLARLQPGERVLIHAAAGGVGQAAVQLATKIGAEIFATASPAKWDYLANQGIRHVMSSRTLDFADRVMQLTGGRGVDCVLNSLTGQFINKSLGVMAERGRFVELGRIGIWSEKEIHQVRPDVSYFNFDMAQICHDDPALIAALFSDLAVQFREHTLAPIPHNVFPIQDVASAFRFMAQAKHIGKVVLDHPRQDSEDTQARRMIRSDAVYVVTGGLGALGMQVAAWMVSKGARKLVLVGRSAPSEEAHQSIGRMRQAEASITVVQADVSDRAAVERLLAEAATLGPVHGIIHAAGVLDDGILLNLDWPRFRKVMAPKMDGAWNLHELSLNLPLDFFICYSSMASLLGSPGQGNYAAANAFLDALAHHRRALGLPSMTINWGPWAGSGMAGRLDSRTGAVWNAQGVELVPAELALDLLEQLWTRDAVQVGVQPLNWSKFLRQFPAGTPPLLEAFAHEDGRAFAEKSKFLETLESTPLSERLGLLQDEIRVQIASVLGVVSLDEIELRAPLFNLGLDSLMAVEVKNRLERTLSCAMRPTLVFDYPTVEALASYFAQEPLAALFAPPSELVEPEAAAEDAHAIADELARELRDLEQVGGR